MTFDAFTDLATYFSLDPSFYSPNIIVPLSGGTYRRLALSADGTRLALTSDLGGTLVDIPAVGSGGGGEQGDRAAVAVAVRDAAAHVELT